MWQFYNVNVFKFRLGAFLNAPRKNKRSSSLLRTSSCHLIPRTATSGSSADLVHRQSLRERRSSPTPLGPGRVPKLYIAPLSASSERTAAHAQHLVMNDPSEEEEASHLADVVTSFCEYALYMTLEARRRARAVCLLPAPARAVLPDDVAHNIRKLATECCPRNAEFLGAVVADVQLGGPREVARPAEVVQRVRERAVVGVLHVQHLLARSKAPEERDSAEKLAADLDLARLPFGGSEVRTARYQQRKVHQTLHSIVREWTVEGAPERMECFSPIIEELRRHVPVTPQTLLRRKVVVPGCGLGRLVAEIVNAGYRAQGNEFCYQMLLVSDYILNRMGRDKVEICPWIDSNCNEVHSGDNLRSIEVPDVAPLDILQNVLESSEISQPEENGSSAPSDDKDSDDTIPPFSMAAGEFLQVYQGHTCCWDAVVTCFFLDTAPQVTSYISAIFRMLKPGGVWINFGPLMWHWAPGLPGPVEPDEGSSADPRYQQSIELSYDQVRSIMENVGFEMLNEEFRSSPYACNSRSMMTTQYKVVFFTARKP